MDEVDWRDAQWDLYLAAMDGRVEAAAQEKAIKAAQK